ncbi:hypothetical protein JAAARDRAFT_146176 [Jaapia argillacea MUCL 33604]|uniref:DUF962-domain-containing protein n=1 Tax=Jaapia argillacea MUCL 33604 TaxID=933084 RepID=A0A067QQJ6_9AGAM|nr:hypothetical protein JAAARDRAFT_146176 [Jaapia argillacea MUCL 33604]
MSKLFDVEHQLAFYGAYHHNPVNVAIHMVCVPILLWSFSVMASTIPVPASFPVLNYTINQYLTFELNWASIHSILYLVYYFALEPVAALLYTPQLTLSILTAIAFSKDPTRVSQAMILHGISWVAQFLGHGVAEKRAPALIDNLVGAVVLAPFFVHLELLFKFGYRPALQKKLDADVEKELARIKKEESEKKKGGKKEL